VSEDFFCEEIAVAEMSASKKAEFLTKYCNIKQNSSIAWLDAHVVEGSAAEITLADFRKTYAVGGIDLSQTTDLTAASIVIEREAVCVYTVLHARKPRRAGNGNRRRAVCPFCAEGYYNAFRRKLR
jgi:phage terminase large subunit-like protein